MNLDWVTHCACEIKTHHIKADTRSREHWYSFTEVVQLLYVCICLNQTEDSYFQYNAQLCSLSAAVWIHSSEIIQPRNITIPGLLKKWILLWIRLSMFRNRGAGQKLAPEMKTFDRSKTKSPPLLDVCPRNKRDEDAVWRVTCIKHEMDERRHGVHWKVSPEQSTLEHSLNITTRVRLMAS